MAIYFDASDVDYMVNHFTVPELRSEIAQRTPTCLEDWFTDFVSACRLAIDILNSYNPRRSVVHKESIESIKGRYDLAEYIGRYVPLRKAGNRFVGKCPFHSDKAPSFVVYPNQSYHCFGCQKSGDIITFVQEYENVDIKEAIKRLS